MSTTARSGQTNSQATERCRLLEVARVEHKREELRTTAQIDEYHSSNPPYKLI